MASPAVHASLAAFLETLSRLYAQLVGRAFDDGVQHYLESIGRTLQIDLRERDKALAKILRFHTPSILKLYNEALGIGLLGQHPDEIDAWFERNSRRIEQALEGMLWSAGEAGYALAAQTDNKAVWWNLDGAVERHCAGCLANADGSPYTYSTLPSIPGDGSTPCTAFCMCWFSTK